MAIVGIVDSIVAARENGAKYGYAVSANRDLVAMGGLGTLQSEHQAEYRRREHSCVHIVRYRLHSRLRLNNA